MYAYSVSCYSPTIVVEAETEAEAEAKMEEAMKADKFGDLESEVDWDGCSDERVLVIGPAKPDAAVDDLDNLR